MRLIFDWDPDKARSNLAKHGVSFEDAMTVFRDRLAVTIFDPDHSIGEDRWITLGLAADGVLLLVVHTHVEILADQAMIRIISARRPNRNERHQYEDGALP
jgi:uncharacterized DUF497 family protein